MILPGGFSYGDYLRSGAIARFSPIMQAVQRHAADGGAVLGICNGFQILCEAHLLPGALMRNAGLTFVSKPVDVVVERTDTVFTSAYAAGDAAPDAGRPRRRPLRGRRRHAAHARGRRPGRAAVRSRPRRPRRSSPTRTGPPTTSPASRNAAGTVVGIMPHPERVADPLLGAPDGLGFFTSLAAWQPRDTMLKVPSQ